MLFGLKWWDNNGFLTPRLNECSGSLGVTANWWGNRLIILIKTHVDVQVSDVTHGQPFIFRTHTDYDRGSSTSSRCHLNDNNKLFKWSVLKAPQLWWNRELLLVFELFWDYQRRNVVAMHITLYVFPTLTMPIVEIFFLQKFSITVLH
jgi:hypothetical protein